MKTPEESSNRTRKQCVSSIGLILVIASAIPGVAQERALTSLTVYPQGLALVRAELDSPLPAGTHAVRIDGLPTSVEQASLIVLNPGTVLQGVHGYRTYEDGSTGGASLVIDVEMSEPVQILRIAYLARGVDWSASYTMQVAPDERSARIDGYASIINDSGARFADAEVQLLAGEVNVVAPRRQAFRAMDAVAMAAVSSAPKVQEQAFAGYHVYTVSDPLMIEAGESRRIRLMGADAIAVVRELVLTGGVSPRQRQPEPQPVAVEIRYRVARTIETEFGVVPLPAGAVRIYSPDPGGRLQLLGMSRIGNTPVGQELLLSVGRSFDVTAVRSQTGFRRIGNNERESDWSLKLSNASDVEATVQIIERIGGDWRILSSSHDPQIMSTAAVRFDVMVPPAGDAELLYSVSIRN